MRDRLFWKLAVGFVAVLLVFTLILGTMFLSLFRSHTLELHREELEAKALSISATLGDFLSGRGGMGRSGQGGMGAYLRYLDELAMADVWLLDTQMNRLTAGHMNWTTAQENPLPEAGEEVARLALEGQLNCNQDLDTQKGSDFVLVGAPIYGSSGELLGAVVLQSWVDGVDHSVDQGLSALGLSAGVALVFALLAALFVSYRFSRPLCQLRTTVNRLGEGDYSARTQVRQRDEIGKVAGTIDILAQRLAEVDHQREELDRMRDDFIANVSHELRTPVAVLRGSVELLADGTVDDPAEIQEYYGQMLGESRHLERLVNDLLELSRLQNAQFRLETAPVDLRDVLRDAARAIRPKTAPKEITVQLSLPEQEAVLEGDYGRLRQMILILLDNSVKFSPVGSSIEMSLTQQPNGLLLDVADHGSGISPEELPHIFERFRKTSSRENASGTGLGLAIAQQIVQRHGGEIAVESKQGEETAFHISFPVKADVGE